MEPRWRTRPVHETEERRTCCGIDLGQGRLGVVLYPSSLAAENAGPSYHARMLRLSPWRFAQAAGCMTWTHEGRQVLPSRLAEEALSHGMPAPHHPNCANALSERYTSIDGDGLKPSIYILWDDSAPSSLFMTPTFNPTPSALASLLNLRFFIGT